jgi:hypothetical protein
VAKSTPNAMPNGKYPNRIGRVSRNAEWVISIQTIFRGGHDSQFKAQIEEPKNRDEA